MQTCFGLKTTHIRVTKVIFPLWAPHLNPNPRQADRAAAIESLSRSAGVQQLRNLSRDAVRGILEEAFRAADEQQGAGALERSEVRGLGFAGF